MPFNPESVEVGDIVPETSAEQNAFLPLGPSEQNAFLPLGKFDLAQARAALASNIQAYEPSYSEKIRDQAAKYIGMDDARKFFGGSTDELINSLNPITGLTRIPGTIADSAVGFMDESKKGNYLPAMGHALVGELNVLPFAKPIANLAKSDLSKSLAEMAYNHYMEKGIPIPGFPESFNMPAVLGAVKPKGGNNPMNLGSTLPLKEQSVMGKYFSESEITNPMDIFESRLKKHFGNDRNENNRLKLEWQEHFARRLNEHSDNVAYGIEDANIDKVKKEAGEEFAQAFEKSRLNQNDPNIKKLYSPSEIEVAAKHHNDWLQGPMKKYVTNLMGTGLETDPVLQAINNANIKPHELFNRRAPPDSYTSLIQNSAKDRRKSFAESFSGGREKKPELKEMVENSVIGKQTATTPVGQYYEDLIDESLYPKSSFSSPFYNNTKDFPGMQHVKKSDVITDFLIKPNDELGFKEIQNSIFNDLLEGKLNPSKLATRTPANVVQDMIKSKAEEMKALQKSTEAYTGWRQKNHDTMPTDVRFSDAEGNPTNKKLVILDSKLANENPDLVTRNMAQDTKDLNHCVGACGMDNGKYIPMVEPHTGVANKKDTTHGPNYLRRIQKGEINIASLRGPNGESKATFELNPINNKEAPTMRLVQLANGEPKYEVKHGWDSPNEIKYFDTEQEANKYIYDYITKPNQFKVSQLKGKGNGAVVGDEYINDAKNWLNHKHQTGELSNQPFNDIKNLPGVYDLKNKETDIFGKLSKSSDSKDNAAIKTYLQFAQNKIQNDPKLLAKYNSGNLSFSEIIDPYLPRFVTADDIINKLTPK